MITFPSPILHTDDLLLKLDQCWMVGFSHLAAEHKQTLNTLQQIFSQTPIESIESIFQGIYQPQYFRTLAVLRAALQGAQYQALRLTINEALQRPIPPEAPSFTEQNIPPEPLVNGAAHWLMDIAIQGYARLDARTLSAFDNTLSQLQALPERLPLALMLNGLVDELAGAVPVANPDKAPLFRWSDLWTRAMLLTAAQPALTPEPISGTFAVMGGEWHNQNRLFSVSFYGILTTDSGASWVKTTFSTYKVNAISTDELWALLPQAQPLVEAFRKGHTLTLEGMSLLPTGDLLWNEAKATQGEPYTFTELAKRYLIPNAPEALTLSSPLPEKYHPAHIAEPVLLTGYKLDGDTVTANGLSFKLVQPEEHKELPKFARHEILLGLIRYDNQDFYIQPLALAQGKKAPAFATIRNSAKLFEIPAKSAINLLRERASRLLREKS